MNKELKIIGIDPGIKTGLALVKADLNLKTYKFLDGKDFYLYYGLDYYFKTEQPDLIIIEDFEIQTTKVVIKPSVETIGVVKYLGYALGIKILLQSPSIVYRYFEELKNLRKSKHVKCALSHIIYYLKNGRTYQNQKQNGIEKFYHSANGNTLSE